MAIFIHTAKLCGIIETQTVKYLDVEPKSTLAVWLHSYCNEIAAVAIHLKNTSQELVLIFTSTPRKL